MPARFRIPSLALLAAVLLASAAARASDHADPIFFPTPLELLNNGEPSATEVRQLAGGITDLFLFPVNKAGVPLSFPREDESRRAIPSEHLARLAKFPLLGRDKLLTVSRAQRDRLLTLKDEQLGKLLAQTNEQIARLIALNDEQLAAEIGKLPAAPPPGEPEKIAPISREERARLERLTPGERWQSQRLSEAERAQTHALVLILCVRRALIQPPPLELAPYTYAIHMDRHTPISFDRVEDQPGRARYGGNVTEEAARSISPDFSFRIELTNEAMLKKAPTFTKLQKTELIEYFPRDKQSAIRDDPFIFPPFFGTNVVAMAFKVPLECFGISGEEWSKGKQEWILWATSHRGGNQVDHVGRSLRTQQPRFAQILNDVEPRNQVAAIDRARTRPGLLPNVLLRAGVPALFNYRNWDRTPDLMIYNAAYDTRYPNGRLLTDDVAPLLAENGDALLLELSYTGDTWPRRTENDKKFLPDFPYLAEPWKENDPGRPPLAMPPRLTTANKVKLVLIALVAIGLPFLVGWLLASWRCRKRERNRHVI